MTKNTQEIINSLKNSIFFDEQSGYSPVTISEIRQVEKEIGQAFPPKLREFYTSINGFFVDRTMYSDDDIDYTPIYEVVRYVYDLQMVIETWKELNAMNDDWTADGLNDPANPVASFTEGVMKPYFWQSSWIPFADSGRGEYHLDFDPAEGGRLGQVIYRAVDGDGTQVVAPSFYDWLVNYFELDV